MVQPEETKATRSRRATQWLIERRHGLRAILSHRPAGRPLISGDTLAKTGSDDVTGRSEERGPKLGSIRPIRAKVRRPTEE